MNYHTVVLFMKTGNWSKAKPLKILKLTPRIPNYVIVFQWGISNVTGQKVYSFKRNVLIGGFNLLKFGNLKHKSL